MRSLGCLACTCAPQYFLCLLSISLILNLKPYLGCKAFVRRKPSTFQSGWVLPNTFWNVKKAFHGECLSSFHLHLNSCFHLQEKEMYVTGKQKILSPFFCTSCRSKTVRMTAVSFFNFVVLYSHFSVVVVYGKIINYNQKMPFTLIWLQLVFFPD